MAEFKQGDVISFRLRGDSYGVATIAYVENLSLHDNVHLVIHDAVIGAEEVPEEQMIFSDEERRHAPEDIDTSAIVVDHLGITYAGLMESEPLVVGERDIVEEDLIGYRVWIAMMRKAALEQGILRSRRQDVPEEREEELSEDEIPEEAAPESTNDAELDADGDLEPEEDGDSWEDESDAAGDDGEEAGSDDVEELSDEDVLAEVEVSPWHTRLFDRPIGAALFEIHDMFAKAPLDATTLGAFIASFYDGSKTEEIEALIARLLDGDYAAATELLEFGDPAVPYLRSALDQTLSPDVAGDILQILGDMGNDAGYQTLADFFDRHRDLEGDPLAIPAARAFAYVVMLTGGTPEPLASGVERLAEIDHPELAADVASAMNAVRNVATAGTFT